VTSYACYDVDGSPCVDEEGIHKSVYKRNYRGDIIETSYFDEFGRPSMRNRGYHKETTIYDNMGNGIERAYFDTKGVPITITLGYHKEVYEYDDKGNQITQALYDTLGNSCEDNYGVHKYMFIKDEHGYSIEESVYNKFGEPTIHGTNGTHKGVVSHDDFGNIIGFKWFNTSGLACVCKDGYHKREILVSRYGKTVETIDYDESNNPSINIYNYNREIIKYDNKGNRIESSYYDTEGKPCMTKWGFHKSKETRDAYGEILSTSYYDTSDNLIADLTMTPFIDFDYTGQGRVSNNSYILKWGGWEIGNSINDFWNELSRNTYKPKQIVYLTQNGNIEELNIDKGKAGLQFRIVNITQQQYDELRTQYKNWTDKDVKY
jgi:hypothetical protein